MELLKYINEIIGGDTLTYNNTYIVCGAGISKDSGIPLGSDIIQRVYEDFDLTKEFVKIGKEKEKCCCQYVITDGIQYSDWFGEGLVEERRPAHDSCIPKKKPIKMSVFCR